ncbi:MAG: VOC family protein [Deltaproteobacteria bacterium]|nr:VOC family protein [Myxococcales bacterium]MDP3218620.1 VOC family protein [Deltaproteobacteria bacterium]
MTLSFDEVVELDACFAELLDADRTDVTARFALEPDDDPLEFDLRTPSRWSELPRLALEPTAPRTAVVGVEPLLVVHDAAAAIDFYARAFGGVERARDSLPDGRIVSAVVAIDGFVIQLCDDFPELRSGRSGSPAALGGTPVTLHLTVEGIDRFFARATRAGARVLYALHDVSSLRRHGVVEDPFGHRWSLSSAAPP